MGHPCDLCGRSRHVGAIKRYEDILWLCPRCDEYVDYQPVKLAETVKTFIIGNAL